MAKAHICRLCGGPAAIAFDEPTAHEQVANPTYQRAAWCETCCPSHVVRVDVNARPPRWGCVYCGQAAPPPDTVH